MKRGLAIWLGICLGLWLGTDCTHGQPESSLGDTRTIPPIVGREQTRLDSGEPFGPMGMTGPCPEVPR